MQSNPLLVSAELSANLQYAQKLQATEDPTLRIFGRLVDVNVRSGRTGLAVIGEQAANRYCGIARDRP